MRATILIRATFALVLVTAGCGGDVAIGVSTSSSFMAAAELAIEDALAANPGLRVDTMLIPERTNEAGPALAAAERFVTRGGVVAVIGHSNSSASLATAGVYNQHGIVQLTPTSSATVFSEAGRYSFRLVPPDHLQTGFLVDHLRASLPAGARVALFHVSDDYGRGLRDGVRPALQAAGLEVVFDLPYGEQDRGPEGLEHARDAVAAAGPHAILWLGRASTLDGYLPVLRAAAPGAEIIGSDGVGSGRTLTDDGRWSGVRYVDFLDVRSDLTDPDFLHRFEARLGRPPTSADVLTYDAVRLVLAGIGDGARSGAALRRYLESLGASRPAYAGLAGPIAFDTLGDISRGYTMVTLP
jgi:branched-chain amino acid transport system substrate-binding protein